MQILVVVNSEPYSNHAIDQAARLAANTLAKVTILGVDPGKPARREQSTDGDGGDGLLRVMEQHQKRFIGHFSRLVDIPFARGLEAPAVRVCMGNASKDILRESHEEESDLIALGCDGADGSAWANGKNVPRQIAGEADCSVYIAKKARSVDRVVCCLGHEEISQQSLEMVSQFVTLYSARLQMVGLLEHGALKSNIEGKLGWLISYYSAKNIEPWVEVVETKKFDDFVSTEARYALMALWMGKGSLLRRIYSKAKLNRLVKTSESSVLVLR